MKIKREVVTSVMVDDNTKLIPGDTVVFIANGVCHIGEFVGITKRGCLSFNGVVKGEQIVFNILPKSISVAEVIEHGIN